MDHVKQKAKENPYVQRYQTMKKRPQTEAQARRNMMTYLKNTAGFRMDYFKGMSYDDIRPIFEAKFNSNIEFLLKTKEQIEEEENRAIASINETPAQKATKRRRLNEEAKDVEELKQHLEIVSDEDDDVYTEATPLAKKVPVVDYQIIHFNNKPHHKIIRVDETHQLYVSFIILLKNFDREDLESLWSIVKERFSTSKPNNFLDDFLLTTLKVMFERPDGQDQAKVKSWKLLESCGVHIVALTTTQLIMLVEIRYPLSSAAEKNDAAKSSKDYQAANARYWKTPSCYDDDDDAYAFAITPNEPVNSLSIGDEHLDTISATKSDEFIKSSVEKFIPNPSEFEGENECDMPVCEAFTTFLNVLFDAEYENYSSDDRSFSDEDFPKEIYSNPLFDEEIISMKTDQQHFNVVSDLIESMLNHDSLIISSSKIDSLFDEFAGELTLLKSISSRTDETDCDPEEETYFIKRLFNDSLSLPEIESFHFDIPLFSRPLAKPPDGNTGILNVKLMGDISEQKVPMPRLMITLVPNQEKSYDLLSHQGLETFDVPWKEHSYLGWFDIKVYRSFRLIFLDVISIFSLEYEHVAMNLTLQEQVDTISIFIRTSFQVLRDPSGLKSSFNGTYKFLSPCYILISPKPRVHTRIRPIDPVLLRSVIQCFQNTCQCTITELVHLVKPHDLSFIVVDREHYCSRRLNDGIIMFELEAFRFSEVQLCLVAFNAELKEDDQDDLAKGADLDLQSHWDTGS
nr:hypothetical protein [Tanacetum cinerariifolium]